MIYIAFLRGVNVGGKNILKMADLKQALISIGLSRVQTYIQSGNALFESDEEEKPLRQRIEQTLQAGFNLPIAVILRTIKDLEQATQSFPFTEEEVNVAKSSSESEVLYVALLERSPLAEESERLTVYNNENDQFRIIGREIFLLFHHSIRESKLANNLQKLNIPMIIRNWNTIQKLLKLANAMTDSAQDAS